MINELMVQEKNNRGIILNKIEDKVKDHKNVLILSNK